MNAAKLNEYEPPASLAFHLDSVFTPSGEEMPARAPNVTGYSAITALRLHLSHIHLALRAAGDVVSIVEAVSGWIILLPILIFN